MDDQAIQWAEKIDRFLQGKMADEEQKAFEYQLAQNTNLRETFENTDIARQAIRHYGLKSEVQAIRGQMLEENAINTPTDVHLTHESVSDEPQQTKQKRLSFYQYSYRVAAGLVLVCLSFVAIQTATVSPEGLYASNMELNISNDITRGKGETTAQTALLDAYQQNNFEQTINLYADLKAPALIESYFAAAAYLQLNQFDEAINTYQQILANDQEGENEFLQQESSYKLALTYIRQREYDEALPILENLDDHYAYYDHLISYPFLWKLKLLRFKDSLLD